MVGFFSLSFNKKKSHIRGTSNLSTYEDRSTLIKRKSIQNDSLFLGSTSWSTNAPVHQSNTSHALTYHGCNLEQLLVLGLFRVGRRDSSEFVDKPIRANQRSRKKSYVKGTRWIQDTYERTLQLLDQIGPVGQFGEKGIFKVYNGGPFSFKYIYFVNCLLCCLL